jgi:flagellar protein FliS
MSKSAQDQQYKLIDTETGVVDADPHHLIVMLFKGSLEKLAVAKGCMQRNEIAAKGEALTQAISIVGGLLDSVDPEAGDGILAKNLTELYYFVTQRVTDANVNDDIQALQEAIDVLKQLESAWLEIAPSSSEHSVASNPSPITV